jgi:signal transduction histidine kinase
MLQQALTAILDRAAAAAFPVTLLALTVSAVIVVAGWRRRRSLLDRQGRPFDAGRIELGRTPFAAGVLEVAAEAMAVMQRFESLAAQRFVALELAVEPELAVHTDAHAFREILGDLVTRAIEQPACERVLLGAARIGGRVQITVSDDGPHADRALRESQLRAAQRLAALQGATMAVDARAGQGTTVVLRLPAGATSRQPGAGAEAVDPASIWAPAQRAREDSGAERSGAGAPASSGQEAGWR